MTASGSIASTRNGQITIRSRGPVMTESDPILLFAIPELRSLNFSGSTRQTLQLTIPPLEESLAAFRDPIPDDLAPLPEQKENPDATPCGSLLDGAIENRLSLVL